jgi:hypothetical protein
MEIYAYRDVEHTSVKDGLYNMFIGEMIIRVPIHNIFDIVEDYRAEEEDEPENMSDEKVNANIL